MQRQRNTIAGAKSRSNGRPVVRNRLGSQMTDFEQIHQKVSYVLNRRRGWIHVSFNTPTGELSPMRLIEPKR